MSMRREGIWFRRVLALLALTAAFAMAAPAASNAVATVKAPVCTCTITVTPTSGGRGASVTVKGAGFTAAGFVRIRFVDSKGTIWRVAKPKNVKVASDGTFSVRVRVPKPATKGVGRFVAVEPTSTQRAVAKFLVT